MAYVARCRQGWEIRETVITDGGPNSRTLSTFERLDRSALDRARDRSSQPIDFAAVIKSALSVGAPVDPPEIDAHAVALIRELDRGAGLRPALRRLLVEYLNDSASADPGRSGIVRWLGSTARERGDALVDLLLLADAISPRPRPAELAFPGFRRSDG